MYPKCNPGKWNHRTKTCGRGLILTHTFLKASKAKPTSAPNPHPRAWPFCDVWPQSHHGRSPSGELAHGEISRSHACLSIPKPVFLLPEWMGQKNSLNFIFTTKLVVFKKNKRTHKVSSFHLSRSRRVSQPCVQCYTTTIQQHELRDTQKSHHGELVLLPSQLQTRMCPPNSPGK